MKSLLLTSQKNCPLVKSVSNKRFGASQEVHKEQPKIRADKSRLNVTFSGPIRCITFPDNVNHVNEQESENVERTQVLWYRGEYYLLFCVKDLALLVPRPPQLLLLEVRVCEGPGDLHSGDVDFGGGSNDKLLVCSAKGHAIDGQGPWARTEQTGHQSLSTSIKLRNEAWSWGKSYSKW